MSKQALLSQLTDAIVEGNKGRALSAAQSALDAGTDPIEVIQAGVAQGMTRIGKMFQEFEVFLPELMKTAEAGKACLDLVMPRLKDKEAKSTSLGKVVLGTVVGDVHDIGKNLVGAVLASSGFEVYDIGVNVPPLDFVKKAAEVKATIIAMSSLLTTSLPYQKDTIDYLNDMGVREQYFVIIGGGPVTPEWAAEIKADGYARMATEAFEVCRQLVTSGKKPPLDSPIIKGVQTKD